MNNTNNESGAVRIQAGDLRRLDHLRDINLTTDTMDFQKLAGEYKSELLDSVLPFWLEHSQDKQYGGYFTCLERDGSVYDTDKFIWLQGREVWLFSMLYNKVAKRPEWLECALQGAEFLKKYGHDGNYNWYFSLTRDGRPLVDPYNIFSYTFATMAFAQLAIASGDAGYAAIAKKTFDRVLEKRSNPKGKWCKAHPGTRPIKDFALPMILCNLSLEIEQLIDKMKEDRGVKFDVDLTAADLKELAEQFKAEYKNQLGSDFPSDPVEQLKLAIEAVFRSWDNPRANVYRRDNDIPYSWGTAVNVMPMVFGNLNNESGTGVAFTRDPATGENKLMGEFLINAQGEDVVAGVRTPMPIAQMEQEFPEAYAEFLKVCETLENHYHDMQDMEFTVENKKLYMLQCRNGKRTAPAALKIACDLVDEGHKTPAEAVAMIDPRNLDTLLHPQFDAAALKAATPLGKGLGASPGAACGKVVFTADDAEAWAERGEKVVLVRLETSPEDITGMKAAQGILTVRGGMTSHAAVVARGMGTCCVSGCGDINMDEENKKFTLAGQTFTEGSEISIDGTTGNIYAGIIPTVDASIAGEFGRVMAWADEFRRLKVRTNADTPADAKKARELGAEGIGLCRTEHMFFDPERIAAFREMICSDTVEERETALNKILPYQQGDFEKLYEALEGCPVTIRFLDPPLHEFVPTEEADIEKLAKAKNKSVEEIKAICESLHEFNPMMGHRGCRLAVTYPEIAKMQTKAVIRAAINVKKAHPDWDIEPEIMIPLVCEIKELKFVKKIVVETADAEIAAANADIKYHVGTMIEIPRAALTADEIATEADFFCFGTNDLTQMTFGFSRDDAGKFLNAYYDNKIFENDPFAKLDQTGVGKLMETAIKLGKPVNPNLHVGICGEHGGDPSSVEFCHKIGLDYVSCSPFRVPIARLAAAQAAIANK